MVLKLSKFCQNTNFHKHIFALENLNNLTATLNAEASGELNSKELDKLFDEDPNEAAKIERKIRRRKENIVTAQRKLRTHQNDQLQNILREFL